MATRTSAHVEVRLLGGLEITAGGHPLPLVGPKQRALFAYLALHANETVSGDRLVDALWGEQPPPTAPASLRVTLSKLRRRLSDAGLDDRLVTSPAGYTLRVEPDEIDVLRFASLTALGRSAFERGDYVQAAETLREALALWSGPALADLAYEPFASSAAAKHEEDRLAALEARLDADLALGRHRELVGELETLVAAHPMREAFARQLMLALYRSGRQAEALAVYRRARTYLVDELGIEPGKELSELERAILAHDTGLDLARASEDRPEAQSPSAAVATLPRRRPLLLPAVLVAAAALATALALILRSGDGGLSAVSPNSVGVIDPATNHLAAEVPVGIRPSAIAVGEGAVWVTNADDQTVSRIDPASRKVTRTIPAGGLPADISVSGGSVWALLPEEPLQLARIVPEFGEVERLPVKRKTDISCSIDASTSRITVADGYAWMTCSTFATARIDLDSGLLEVTARPADVPAYYEEGFYDIAVGLGSPWVVNRAINAVTRIDPSTNAPQVQQSITVGKSPHAIAFGDRSLWVANREDDTVSRVDIRLGQAPVVTTIPVGDGPVDVAYGEGAVWVANNLDGTVSRIDTETNKVVATIPVGGKPQRVAGGEGAVWVTLEPPIPTG